MHERIIHHGEETDFPIVIRNPAPQYAEPYVGRNDQPLARDGDNYGDNFQIYYEAVVRFDIDNGSMHVRGVHVTAVVMYARPEFDEGVEVPFTARQLEKHAAFVKAIVEADEHWQRETLDRIETRNRTGDDY